MRLAQIIRLVEAAGALPGLAFPRIAAKTSRCLRQWCAAGRVIQVPGSGAWRLTAMSDVHRRQKG